MPYQDTRLVVVSNRLPVAVEGAGPQARITAGKGGLVTALAPVLRDRGGVWIGWSGAPGQTGLEGPLRAFSEEAGYSLHTVELTEGEVQGFYLGFSNEVVWPLFHDFQSRCNFVPGYWRSYLEVNRKFAAAITRHSRRDDYVWVHDYHLMHVARMLREQGEERRLGFFLHIPFPPPDIFFKLPWRSEVIRALAEFDMVGFQTIRDRRNFLHCLAMLCPESRTLGRGPVMTAAVGERKVRVGYFPISIDFRDFSSRARTPRAAEAAAALQGDLRHRTIVLGADRLDYSKGIPQRFEAMRSLLSRYPELRNRISLLQIVVPSREDLPEYQAMKEEIDRLAGDINSQFGEPGYMPIQYLYRNLDRDELVAAYRAAGIGLVTPLRDGMNLVAKEYCACNIDEQGVLILSEFAGAAAQLQGGALLVNPYDVEGVADAMRQAILMAPAERRARMHRMRAGVRRYDIFWWVDSFIQAAFGRHLEEFPQAEMAYHAER
ncbi:MAG: trehalose-6-phosphate synthase [Thermodesulfobacteriota bacterium]